MGYIYAIIIILIIAAFIEYPVISIAVASLLIFLIVKLVKSSENNGLRDSENVVELAVEYIEEAYKIAIENESIEPSVLTMYIQKEGNSDNMGFQVVLYTHETYRGSVEYAISEYYGWEIHTSEDDDIYIDKEMPLGIKCGWNKFNAAVWNRIKERHPEWKVGFVRDNKSAISF